MNTTQVSNVARILEIYKPYGDTHELWVHRTRFTRPGVFFEQGLRVARLQQGLASTAVCLAGQPNPTDLAVAVQEASTRYIEEDPTNNARLFIVVPNGSECALEPFEISARFMNIGLLPARYVMAHLNLLSSVPELEYNSRFNPEKS